MKSLLNSLAVILAVIGLFLALPILLPYLAFEAARRKQRLLKCVSSTACEECGNILGTASIELSNEIWKQHVQELPAKHPGVRFRTIRPHDSICPNCRTEYRFNNKQCELVRVWLPDVRTVIDEQRRDLPDSSTKRALKSSRISTPKKHNNRWLFVYDVSPKVLYDPKADEYAFLGDDNQVTVVGDIATVVSSIENSN